MKEEEGEDDFDWDAWWRVPPGLPRLETLPDPPPGHIHLVHHANGRTVALYDPGSGRAEPRHELADAQFMRDPRVAGRYLPLRSGVLAYYRDAEGRAFVQHRRRRVPRPPRARATLHWLLGVRTLTLRLEGKRLGRLLMVDMPGRWMGPAYLRSFDFTAADPVDFDLGLAIEEATNGSGNDWI